MIKAILGAVLMLVLADFAVDHGDQTKHVLALAGSFVHWAAHMGDGSIFGK